MDEIKTEYLEMMEDLHPADIIAKVRKKGSTFAELSRTNGLHSRTLHNVLYKKWPKAEKIIADFLELKPEEIWPSRYPSSTEEINTQKVSS